MKRIVLVLALLSCALGSGGFASRLWSWVLNFDPGFAFKHAPIPTGPPLTPRVTILLIDGLRLDASRRMPALNSLRSQGADIEATVFTPSFSRPGRGTVAVGAPPSIHGVTTNRQKRALTIDNLIRRVGAMGGACRIAGSLIWSGLFGPDIARCGVYLGGEGKEGPGAFVRQAPEIRASQEAGIAFVLEQPAALRIADIISTDFAAHEYGGVSPEYDSEVQRIDGVLAQLLSRLDLSKETLVVTADHGHRDGGGHGGAEREVLAIPIVMAGAGIKPGVGAQATQADIAPTVAALLGAGLPTGSSGRPIGSILAAGEDKLALVRTAAAGQSDAFELAVADRLGLPSTRDGSPGWKSLVHAHRHAQLSRRTPVAIALTGLVLLALGFTLRIARPDPWSLIGGLAALFLALMGPIRSHIPVMSFSAINYDEMLMPFFIRIMSLAASAVIVAMVGALVVARVFRKKPSTASPLVLAGSAGVVVCAGLALFILAAWLHHGLLLPATLPGPDRLVEAYALTLSLLSVSLTTLLTVALLWFVEPAPSS